MLKNVRKSSIAICFDGKFANMKKEQNFVIYPVSIGDKYLKIQSEGRMGIISKDGKLVITSKNCNYPNMTILYSEVQLKTAKTDIITPEEMTMIREGLNLNSMGNWFCQVSGNDGAKDF